jgi:hypothetical protein
MTVLDTENLADLCLERRCTAERILRTSQAQAGLLLM